MKSDKDMNLIRDEKNLERKTKSRLETENNVNMRQNVLDTLNSFCPTAYK